MSGDLPRLVTLSSLVVDEWKGQGVQVVETSARSSPSFGRTKAVERLSVVSFAPIIHILLILHLTIHIVLFSVSMAKPLH